MVNGHLKCQQSKAKISQCGKLSVKKRLKFKPKSQSSLKICFLLVCWGLLGIISFVSVSKQNRTKENKNILNKANWQEKFKICRTLPLQPLKRWTVDLKWTRICYKKLTLVTDKRIERISRQLSTSLILMSSELQEKLLPIYWTRQDRLDRYQTPKYDVAASCRKASVQGDFR